MIVLPHIKRTFSYFFLKKVILVRDTYVFVNY